ncbi:FecCD family ABC transporter permease [Alteribacillus bidgolensis]|uniref:Iron complex transport system permease protein n=1 Tax=Alteribacillus bidgolensis TaxID=930129 RepID=A0A1G8NLY8_9BACI|nr:iron ABC transporter permease [Alteribacillus bidgolensis]SDI81279.1 iron complex transport system permease protein [Alteribacillus bidgolensis]
MKRYVTFRNKKNTVSFQIEGKTILTLGILVFLVLLACVAGPSLGSKLLHPFEVLQTIMGQGTGGNEFIVLGSRLPRTLLSLLVGAALGVSGLILQGVVRNPLAAPDIIGVTGGAAVAAVAFLTYLAESLSIAWMPLAAITGALIISIFIYALAWKNGITPIRLVLIGIGISAIMSALTTFMIVVSSAVTANQAYLWLTGSVYGASWEDVFTIAAVVFILLPLVLVFSRSLNSQQLGDDVASGVGVRVQRDRLILLGISVVLAGAAVAAVGAIGFVGLISPHIARTLVDKQFGNLAVASALTGGLILFGADLAARTIFYPIDIPAGVFTAGIGAPFFLYLLFKNRNQF